MTTLAGYSVRILADSLAPNGKRITTWELTYPRFVHAELMTHRLFSRNSASSRAIPVKKLRQRIRKVPVRPVYWGANQKGMQAGSELQGWRLWLAIQVWLKTRWLALIAAWMLEKLGVHKQLANRILEPWMFITVIVTATEFDNWFRLRAHPDAQPEIRWVAEEMLRQYKSNSPERLVAGEWHLPLIRTQDWRDVLLPEYCNAPVSTLRKISVARCARVSYLTHDGRKDYKEDLRLHDDLAKSGHWSPFEHVAKAMPEGDLTWSGNFQGWLQYREVVDKTFTKVGR